MISSILRILKDKNIIESPSVLDYTYSFNNRANINLFIYRKSERKPLFFMKISNLNDFKKTFNNMKMVYSKFPEILPEPICLFQLEKFQVLVMKPYDIELLITKPHFDAKEKMALLNGVIDNIKKLQLNTMNGCLTYDEHFCKDNILPAMNILFERWRDDKLLEQFKLYIGKLTKYYGITFPSIPQHGDLSVVNIGLIDGRIDKMMFIDWDSYSEVKLPMYDLLIFLESFVDFYGENYDNSELTAYIKKEVLSNYCKTVGLDLSFVIDLYGACRLLVAKSKCVDTGVFVGQEIAFGKLRRVFEDNEWFIHYV